MAEEQYKDYLAARVLTEHMPVTYRLLSRALKTNVNTAKRSAELLLDVDISSLNTGCSLSFTRSRMHGSKALSTPPILSLVRREEP